MKITICLFITLILLASCSSEYDKTMRGAYSIKKSDPNLNPIFDGEVEPPIPDKSENDKTVLGIDSNHNGIRDDVDIWINRTALSSNERRAMRQFAKEEQKWLKVGMNPTRKEVDEVAATNDHAGICLQFFTTVEREDDVNHVFNTILDLSGNTDLRVGALKENNRFSYSGGSRDYNYTESYKYCVVPIEHLDTEIVKFNQRILKRRK